ncbi:uncharacterized protein BDR25DRAFT_255515 [Lindgomyces ingoldianus]|uniref:Uncharacterized protein n=1 Tax=Lindgomyces ingoldianus TaxID=673940 RepID=A0ACB6R9I4_9PLEO|nr:uncharacterized protein BDR25DRAFT_255515 [Lindgomyces ingoldianus]KAF2474982.1 hypothetical protein BDR25DRAFT_255515 [Lindgomyces ingoldianus]
MPTPIDRATHLKAPFFAFAAIITGVAAWSIWGGDIFPSQDPTGDPENWSHEECSRWLRNRNLHPSPLATTAELLERVKANMRAPRS